MSNPKSKGNPDWFKSKCAYSSCERTSKADELRLAETIAEKVMGTMMQCAKRWSWCLRRVTRLNKGRALATQADDIGYKDDDDVLRETQEFLDGLTGDMKKKLQLIEMDYQIRRANNEHVPPHLTSRQKKQLLLNIPKEDHLHYLQTLTDIKAHWSVRAERKRKENKEMQLFVDMKEDTFIYANERKFFYTYIKHRMAQTFLTGMPIVFDVGYPMDSGDIASFLKVLCRAHHLAKHHKQPANLIVSGLSKNPEMKEMIESRPDLTRMMVGYRDEQYWTLFPDMPIVYICNRGPELKEFDGNKLYVLFSGTKSPFVKGQVPLEQRTIPYNSSLFASSGSSMLDCKAKILMDLSLDRDIDKALLDNVESGAFNLYMGPRKRYEFTNEYMLRTEGTNT